MTDLDRFTELLKDFGIVYERDVCVESGVQSIEIEFGDISVPEPVLHYKGYCGFSSVFSFDLNGKFNYFGCFE